METTTTAPEIHEIFSLSPAEILAQHSGLVHRIARKWHYHNRHKIDLSDLTQIGSIALLDAPRTFKPEKGSWSAHAWRQIERDIARACLTAVTVRESQQKGYRAVPCVSTSAAIGSEDDGSMTVGDTLADSSLRPDADDDRDSIFDAVNAMTLSDLERMILTDHLMSDNPLTLSDLARYLNVSKQHVSKVKQTLVERIRKVIGTRVKRECA